MNSEKEEVIIEEFKTSSAKKISQKENGVNYANYMIPALFGLTFLLAVLAGMFWLKLPVVLVCVILVLEAMIGICLHDTPIWVHGIEVIISIVIGIIFNKTAFMIIGAFLYIAAILSLHVMRQQKG